jgi:2-iminobutanoate/2-iminopropanoate deaminase
MSNRKSIEIPGVTHGKAPIPMGARINNIVCSSGIMGKDTANNSLPQDPIKEIDCLFQNIREFMLEAGGTTDDIIKMNVFLKDNQFRDAFNEEWLRLFPNPQSRPARHITLVDLPGGMNVQVELMAVLS